MPDTEAPLRYLQLRADHDSVDGAGNLEPLNNIGISVPVEVETQLGTMTEQINASIRPADELTDTLHARIIPGTRMVETRLSRVCDLLLDNGQGQFVEIDPPTKKAITAAERETDKHLEYIQEYAAQVASGEAPAPDAADRLGEDPPVAATLAELQARGRTPAHPDQSQPPVADAPQGDDTDIPADDAELNSDNQTPEA